MKQQGMVKPIFIKLHSIIDVITNSSSELFIVDLSKTEGVLREIFEMLKNDSGGYNDTKITSWESYKYKDDYIIPKDMDMSQVYMCDIDHNDETLEKIINKFFTTINLEYKDE